MALYESIQNFPAGVCIKSCRLTAKNRVGVVEVVHSYSEKTKLVRGQGWSVELMLLHMDRDEIAELEAFLLSLRSGSGAFWLGDPFHSDPRGVASGTPVTSGATKGAEELTVTGWDPSVTGQLLANDHVQVGNALHAVLEAVDSDATGTATLKLWPPLRESYADATPVITENARGVFVLTEDVVLDRDVVETAGMTLRAAEVWESALS